MANLLILLCIAASTSAYFVTYCHCKENIAFTEICSYSNSDESTEDSSCLLCDDDHDDDIPPPLPPPPTEDPLTPPATTPSAECLQENQTLTDNTTITWPNTEKGSDAVSDPLCLDEFLKIAKRSCNDGWDDAPNCSSIQEPINPCPSHLTSIDGRYCYTIIKKTKFPPGCPYPGSLGWDDYFNFNLIVNEPVWLPLKRNDTSEYGIDLFRYTELTNKYNIPFQICTQSCRTFFYEGTFLDKECLVYHNSTHVEAVNCDAEYAAVCIYDALPYQQTSLCEQTHTSCKQGDYGADSVCLCETTNQIVGAAVLAEFLLPYQNLLFSSNSCRIALQNIGSAIPIWTRSKINITYTNWAPTVNFDFQYGIMTSEGWMLSDETANCFIYQVQISIKEGQLDLEIENNLYVLEITNYKSFLSKNNKDPIVYCFTDADAKSLIYRIHNTTEVYTTSTGSYVMKFPPINIDQSGPGHYWCQAFLYPNLTMLTSKTKMIRNFTAEYVVLFRLKNYDERLSSYPLTSENLETLQNLFRNELPSTISFYPRIFKINSINETTKEIDITFHLTSADATNMEVEFEELRNIVKAQSMFYFLDFRNVHYCPKTTTQHGGQTITWPRTTWNQTTSPLLNGEVSGHCVTSNIILVQRTCIGNFIDGVYWSPIDNVCQFYPESSLTAKLINISSQVGDDDFNSALNELFEISKEYNIFNTLDFVLTVNFIMDVSVKTLNLDVLTGIVSNLMKISRAVLLSAQLNFKSTDILLQTVERAIETAEFGEWNRTNFAVESIDISKGILGLQLQNCTNSRNCDLIPITNLSLLYNQTYIVTQNVVAAISLSTELYEQIINYSSSNESYTPKLVISIYYGSQLFVELENSKSSALVFGVLLPGFTEEFKGPVSIFYYTDVKTRLPDYNCSYWKFSEANLGTWTIEDTEDLNEAIVCEFYHITNFGIPVTVSDDEFTTSKTLTPKNDEYGTKGDNDLQMCIPDDEVTKKCFTPDQYSNELLMCTVLNLGVPLNEFCLTDNLTLIPTNCFQNFSGEAYISEILDNCTVHELSTPIKDILKDIGNVTNDTYDSILTMILTMTANYQSINDVELLFIASFMKAVTINATIDMSKLAGIVSNLMEVPRSVLYAAQRNFRAVDILISSIELTLANGDCGEWRTDKFAIKCVNINERHMGVLLSNCSNDLNNCDLQLINSTIPPYNLTLNYESIYAVIVLSNILYNQILNYSKTDSSYVPKLMISIYYGSELFVDMEATSSASNLVFGVLLPDFSEEFQGPLLIYYLKYTSLIQYNCSYWKFDDNNYGSWVTESSLLSDEVAVCQFFHLTNFAIPARKLTDPYLDKSDYKANYRYVDHHVSFANWPSTLWDNNLICNNLSDTNKCNINTISSEYTHKDRFCHQYTKQTNLDVLDDNFLIYNHDEMKIVANLPDWSMRARKKSCDVSISTSRKDTKRKLNCQKNITYLLESVIAKISINADMQEAELTKTLPSISSNLNDVRIDIISKILDVMEPSLISLDLLVNIVNICMNISRDKMLEAQIRFQSADKILYNIDRILLNFRSTNQVKRRNILFITVSKEDVHHFQGFFITKDREVICLFQEEKAYNSDDADIDVSVTLSQNLRRQINEAKSNILFAIFYTDVLFPVIDQSKVKLPIIEVLIPNLHEDLRGNILIKYKHLNKGKCSYWDHEIADETVTKTGSWKWESQAEFDGNVVTCYFHHVTHFALVDSLQTITTDLEQILASNLTALEKLRQVISITTSNHNNLAAIDIFLISQIITDSLSEGALPLLITKIISILFMVPRDVLRESQKAHTATDIILYAVDEMAQMISDLDSHHQNFSLIVKNLDATNLTGLMLYGCKGSKCSVDELSQFVNISDYCSNESISAMVIFSEELINQIRNFSENPKVAISVYYSDALFNEVGNTRNTTKIFGVIFPGLTDILNGSVSVIYNIGTTSTSDSNQCAYWDYKADPTGNIENATLGQWINDTNQQREYKMAICSYSHVTHFGMLLAKNDEYANDPILELITDVGCVLSLIGILLILLTAMLFKKWRQNTGNKILINFSIAISLKIVTLYISEYVKGHYSGVICTIIGIILHYAILSECAWMLTVAILQFKRFVEVLGGPPKYVLVKALICGWVFPIIPVVCVIVIDPDNYQNGGANLCYPSNLGLYLGVWLPVLMILTINCIIFTFIIYNVFHKKTEYIDSSNNDILFQWRLALLLFFMLGLNWAFGFLGQIYGDILFTYLYSITASLQGFVLFLFFIVFNKSSRCLYSQSIKQWFYARGIFKVWQSKSKSNSKY